MKTFIKAFVSIFVLILIVGGSYALYLFNAAKNTVEDMHYETERESKRDGKVDLKKQDPVSFLILGVDSKTSGHGRADVDIVVTVNPNTSSIKTVSIPRDTRTLIVGQGKRDKINHAYAFGGPEMSIATVENFLDIPIDHFISTNMSGFRDMVDAVGGVIVYNDLNFTQDHHTFRKGEINLNGEEALAYVRHRKTDPKGDLGRAERQKQVINAVINKVFKQSSSITKIKDILDVLGSNVKTDLTYEQMKDLFTNYIDTKENILPLHIEGHGIKLNGIYYYKVSDEERKRVSQELKNHLNIK